MLRRFKISADGKKYLVGMGEIGGVPQPAPVTPQPIVPVATIETSVPAVEETPASTAQPAASTEADAVPAPMSGTVLKVLANVGDTVSEDQPLLILEAIRMENEIIAEKAGTVARVHVTRGQIANPGEPLIAIN